MELSNSAIITRRIASSVNVNSTVGADDPTSTDRMSLMAVEADRGRGWIADRLLIDFGFYEPCQVSQRLLPAEITGLRWNGIRQALLTFPRLWAQTYPSQPVRWIVGLPPVDGVDIAVVRGE